MLARIGKLVVVCITAGLLATLGACGKSPTAPPSPIDLTGTWTGQLGQPGSTTALRLTWVAIHSGDVVSGVATVVKPVFNVQARGVMTGVLKGNQLFLTYAVPSDSVQGFSRCEIGGIGNAIATNTDINGSLGLLFTSCGGTGLEPPPSNELRFTK